MWLNYRSRIPRAACFFLKQSRKSWNNLTSQCQTNLLHSSLPPFTLAHPKGSSTELGKILPCHIMNSPFPEPPFLFNPTGTSTKTLALGSMQYAVCSRSSLSCPFPCGFQGTGRTNQLHLQPHKHTHTHKGTRLNASFIPRLLLPLPLLMDDRYPLPTYFCGQQQACRSQGQGQYLDLRSLTKNITNFYMLQGGGSEPSQFCFSHFFLWWFSLKPLFKQILTTSQIAWLPSLLAGFA